MIIQSKLFLCLEWQVQYTACKDTDGNYISADSADDLGDYLQEIISEERVSFSTCFDMVSFPLLFTYCIEYEPINSGSHLVIFCESFCRL